MASEGTQLRDLVRKRVKLLREERGLTQEQLCERASISVDAVGRIESGSRVPTIDTLEKLARALGVAVEDLLHSTPLPSAGLPITMRRIVSLLEGQPQSVQSTIESITKTLLKMVDRSAPAFGEEPQRPEARAYGRGAHATEGLAESAKGRAGKKGGKGTRARRPSKAERTTPTQSKRRSTR